MPDLASVLEQACVPEHSAPFMQAMSQGTAFLEGEYLFLTADDWLMAIGYPLSGEYAHETFERALAAALRRVPKRLEGVDCWAIGPDLPVRLAHGQMHVRLQQHAGILIFCQLSENMPRLGRDLR